MSDIFPHEFVMTSNILTTEVDNLGLDGTELQGLFTDGIEVL